MARRKEWHCDKVPLVQHEAEVGCQGNTRALCSQSGVGGGVCLRESAHTRTHTCMRVCAGVCALMSVGRRGGSGGVWLWGGGAEGLQQRQQEEHLRLSWHQVLLSCLNESNLPSPLLPSFTKQISFAVCSSLLIQLPQALCWVHQL